MSALDKDQVDAELDKAFDDIEGTTENYNDWLFELVSPYVRGRVLEVGAGVGTFSPQLRALGSSLTAVEPSARLGVRLREALRAVPDATIIEGVLSDVTDRNYDSAVMLNVLEHIEDDKEAIRQVFDRLNPGGTFTIWVPAFSVLYSKYDRQIGHYRRYRRPRLVNLLIEAGFEIEMSRYVNFPGFFAWWLGMRVLQLETTGSSATSVYDRTVVPLTRRAERLVKPPFGQTVLAVARRPH